MVETAIQDDAERPAWTRRAFMTVVSEEPATQESEES